MPTRRALLQSAAFGAGAIAVSGYWRIAFAANDRPLIDSVAAACKRLAPLGWRQLLLDVTGGELDIAAANLPAQLSKALGRIDRNYPGFGDYDLDATRAIEQGAPEQSLLYHAFASPSVVADRRGTELGGFPTLAEIDAVENYVYGVAPPTLAELRKRAGPQRLAIAAFALQYRNTPNSVLGRHAELCFSRSGVARLGTVEPSYDARMRAFACLDPAQPFQFRVVPQRFAAYLAVQMTGNGKIFGPQDAIEGDSERSFWVPIHKLFNGTECIKDLDLSLELIRDLRNDGLARFHRYLDTSGYENNWRGSDLEKYPFLIRNEMLASLSQRPAFGPGVVEPLPAPLATPSKYNGKPLTFTVDGRYTSDDSNLEFSSMQVLPSAAAEPPVRPEYMYDISANTQRPAPEYLNVRHSVLANGAIDNLNRRPDMLEIIRTGGYEAQHYTDLTGDGWVEARCPVLEAAKIPRVPAYCMISPPDFFPNVSQRDLMSWWKNEVPEPIRDALWAIPPLALSQTRIAANIDLPIGFSIDDVTVTAIVTQPCYSTGPEQSPNGPVPEQQTGLPDSSPGIFDPGWDTSQGIYFTDKDSPLQKFLAAYGLGSPFIEDAKLCAALGAYWPGVSPDATRTFQPNKLLGGLKYPWPTIAPLTDEEIGIVPAANGTYMPWDGVRGPSLREFEGRTVVAYTDAMRADYIDIMDKMTAALTSRVDLAEYKARVLAMSAVYWSLGIHDPEIMKKAKSHKDGIIDIVAAKSTWAVRSFRAASGNDAELAAVLRAIPTKLGKRLYRVEIYRWGRQQPDPGNLHVVLVDVLEYVIAYVDGNSVLLRRGNGLWVSDRTMPT
jgi:hypothetical protein